MGVNTATKDADTVAWVSCDDCQAEAPRTQSQDKSRAKTRADRLAEEAGFVWYDGGKTWVCPACRIRRLPDKLKAEFPKLCERYGIPVPALKPEPRPARRVVKRQRATTPATGPQPAAPGPSSPGKRPGQQHPCRGSTSGVESTSEAGMSPATSNTDGEPDTPRGQPRPAIQPERRACVKCCFSEEPPTWAARPLYPFDGADLGPRPRKGASGLVPSVMPLGGGLWSGRVSRRSFFLQEAAL